MRDQSLRTKLLAGCLLAFSTCGTLALFGSVPVIARILSAAPTPFSPRQVQEPASDSWFSEQPPIHSGDRS